MAHLAAVSVASALPVAPTDPAVELAALAAERKAVAARLDAVAAAKLAAAEDPAVKLEEAKLALAREKRAAELAEHELKTDGIYRRACIERGEDRVARLRTRAGSIVLRGETDDETDARYKAIAGHFRASEKASTTTERASHDLNAEETSRDALRECVLSDETHFEAAVERYSGLWAALAKCRDDLISGRVIDEGKDGGR